MTTLAIRIVQRSRIVLSTLRIAVVQPPMAMNAPFPSEIWPPKPVRIPSPEQGHTS